MNFKDLDTVTLDSMGSVRHISKLVNDGYKQGRKRIVLIIDESTGYPNTCAPLAGLIEYYKNKGVKICLNFIDYPHSYVSLLNIEDPYKIEDEKTATLLDSPFDKIWSFETGKGVTMLVNAFLHALRESGVCSEGTFTGLEWCLNETMDNVLVHSQAGKGFVMAQYHKSNNLFSFCVFDYGIGIYNSFRNSKHHPKTQLDAITLALEERITRDDKVGQGNGLWGLHRIVEENEGTLRIISDGAYYQMTFENGAPVFQNYERGNHILFDKEYGSTLIDFQMNTNQAIDVGEALKKDSVVDLWEENLENENGDYVLTVSDISQGTGTRAAALALKNIALNLAINEKKRIIFDFEGVNTISSSYADELFGKIIAEYGIMFFSKRMEIKNLKGINTAILERSIKMRLAQAYYDEIITEED